MKHVPNVLSAIRIIIGACLWFVHPFEKAFYILYSLCGLTDMIDGPLARHLNCESNLGSALDSVGDAVFCLSVIALLFINFSMPWLVVIATIVIGVIKVFIFVIRTLEGGDQEKSHNTFNRALGGTLFVLGYFIPKMTSSQNRSTELY